MKTSYWVLAAAVAGAGAQAQSNGFSSELFFERGDLASVTTVFHPTAEGCEAARERFSKTAATGVGRLIGVSACRPTAYAGGEYVAAALAQFNNNIPGIEVAYTPYPDPLPIPRPRPWPWPWPGPGPWCLSCPPFVIPDYGKLVEFDPVLAERLDSIVQQYHLDEYAARLENLQAAFDLQGAEAALNEVQGQLQRQASKEVGRF